MTLEYITREVLKYIFSIAFTLSFYTAFEFKRVYINTFIFPAINYTFTFLPPLFSPKVDFFKSPSTIFSLPVFTLFYP